MPSLAVFYHECPVCGRSLRIPVQYFGRKVDCGHCGGEFLIPGFPAPNEHQDSIEGLFPTGDRLEPSNLGTTPAQS